MSKSSGLLSHARQDLPAGLVVFLVAMPLCLGIAQASGAPFKSAPKGKPSLEKKPARKKTEKSPPTNIEKTGYEVAYLDELVRREQLIELVMQTGEILRGFIRY